LLKAQRVMRKSQRINSTSEFPDYDRSQSLSQQTYDIQASKLSNTLLDTKLRYQDGYAIFSDGSSTLSEDKAGYGVVIVPLNTAHMAFSIHERINSNSNSVMTAEEKLTIRSSVIAEIFGKVELDSSATTFMGARKRTVNSGEISGLIAAMLWIQLQPIQKAIYVFSDSQYAIGQIVGNNASSSTENKAIVQQGQKLLHSIKDQRRSVLADISNMWAGHLEFLHIKSHSGHPLNDFADDLAKRGADGEECYEGLYECIVKINTGNSRIRFGGSKPLADRYPELLSERNDVYGRVVGMDGRNTYLVQWYVQNAQKGCIYSHEGSEIVKLGDGLEAATRWSFSEEIRIGFPRLTMKSQWAQELGEDGRAQPSPKRKHKRIDGHEGNSPSCSQSQGDESRTIGDGIREIASSMDKGIKGGKTGRNKGSSNQKKPKHTSPSSSQRNESHDSDAMDA